MNDFDRPCRKLATKLPLKFDSSGDLPNNDTSWLGCCFKESFAMTKLRHLIWTSMAAIGLLLSAPQSFAQGQDRGDEPGLIADDSYQLDPEWQKQVVLYRTTEAPGTIIISTAERHLYLIQPGGRAIRYGIGVGRDGFQWQGLLNISNKKEWPDWTPPPEMIARPPGWIK
jgi:hypothetical protein